MIVKRVLVAAQPSESRTYLLGELSRLGCEIVGPFSRCGDALEQLRRESVQMGVISFRLRDGSSLELERRLRSAGTPIVYQVSPGHDKLPVRLRDGRLIAVAQELSVGDLLEIIECDPDFVAGS
jgi:DNA-binding NarL/FixJ family response regulator